MNKGDDIFDRKKVVVVSDNLLEEIAACQYRVISSRLLTMDEQEWEQYRKMGCSTGRRKNVTPF